MDKNFYALKIKNIQRETEKAVSVEFDIPDDLKDKFQYIQGQYLTLRFRLNGQEVRRAYSLCTSPAVDKKIAVTVKKVNKGLVSTHINDRLKVGDTVEVMAPQGRFFTPLRPENHKTYYLFGGGSGITPLMSILKTIVEQEPKSSVYLLYGNYDEESIIFRDDLERLEKKYQGQLTVEHILEEPKKEKIGGIVGLFKKPITHWRGLIGRADGKQTTEFLKRYPQRTKEAEYFICGPSGMMDAVEKALKGQGIDTKYIHIERFTSSIPQGENSTASETTASNSHVIVHLDGKRLEIDLQGKESILDALRRLKHDPPYSCLSGACATCMGKVINGKVKMDACFALDDDEIEKGYILTCQARPISPDVEVTFKI